MVRHGVDEFGQPYFDALLEMMLQVCRDYSGIPDFRTLTASQIRVFYNGLRPELRKHTAPTPPTKRR